MFWLSNFYLLLVYVLMWNFYLILKFKKLIEIIEVLICIEVFEKVICMFYNVRNDYVSIWRVFFCVFILIDCNVDCFEFYFINYF